MDAHIRILVTEDDEEFSRPLLEYLRLNGYAVDRAVDGEEAIAKLRKADLLLLDLHLPGRSGLDVIAYARLHHPDLPVVVMSGRYSPSDTPKIESMGVRGFLSKPFNPDALLALLRRVCEVRQPAAAGGIA